MKNITLAIDEEVLAKVRRLAAEKDTTVNGLVREYLMRLADTDGRAKKAREELVKLSNESSWDPGADWKWNRDDLYDRPILRRYENSDLRSLEPSGGPAKKDEGK